MPELPEVETTRRGLVPHLIGRRIVSVQVRERRLRWPVTPELESRVQGATVRAVRRRAKYLLIDLGAGSLLVHLGMSGRLRLVEPAQPAGRHDHVDIVLDSGLALRLTDPRRFGALLWLAAGPEEHTLLKGLGPEPLSAALTGEWLYAATRGARVAIKLWLMDSRRIVGIGNIYASEALARAGIHPTRAAGRIGRARCDKLAQAIRATLESAIRAGGSTLRDFVHVDGQPGYFQQEYRVYGREGEPCRTCGAAIRQIRQGARSTFYCPACQR